MKKILVLLIGLVACSTTSVTEVPNQPVDAEITVDGTAVPDAVNNRNLKWMLHKIMAKRATDMARPTPLSWSTARQRILREVDGSDDSGQRFTVCVYSGTRVDLIPGSGTTLKADGVRLEIEHTWPRNAEWKNGVGEGTLPEADLHHLYPALGGLNGSRSNHEFGVPTQQPRALRVKADGNLADDNEPGTDSGCLKGGVTRMKGGDAHVVTVFAPPPAHQGNAARAIFYVSVRYWRPIPKEMEAVLKQWHIDDPVDQAERDREARAEAIQGNSNPFVDHPTLVARISNY